MEFKVVKKFPTNAEFNKLFDSVGWGNRDEEKINQNRKGSIFNKETQKSLPKK